MTNIHLIIVVALLVLLGAFFSGTETGIYRLSRFRLRLGLEQRQSLFGILDKLMADSTGVIFSMLLGSNLTASVATSLVTYMFLRAHETEINAEFYSTLIMVPVLFVFANLIPKNIYFYMADRLMPRFAPPAFALHKVFVLCGAVGFLKLLSRLFARLAGAPVVSEQIVSAAQRPHIRQIIQETQEEGMLSHVQTQIIERLVNMPSVRIGSIMTPITKVRMLPLRVTRTEVLAALKETPFRHLPVYHNDRSDILGYINIYEVLSSPTDFAALEPFLKPLTPLRDDMQVIEALNTMRNNHLQMALVARFNRHARPLPLGIVTMKDLVEELIGELAEW
ncbi:MAG: CNNM domain-containing protein [Sedimentisphaerales bacterium]|nr:CNNM domain-containing protein [Sedimentisphaerales bacterium]